jgi:hypothetical protein
MALPNARRTSSGNVRRTSRGRVELGKLHAFDCPRSDTFKQARRDSVLRSGIALSRGDEMRRRATERTPSSRHAHPQNSMNDGPWPDVCAVFNSRRLH